jgi:hypothetical protein
MKYMLLLVLVGATLHSMENESVVVRTTPTAQPVINTINRERLTIAPRYYFYKHMYDHRFKVPGDSYALSLHNM